MILVDTNVLIAATHALHEHHLIARHLLTLAEEEAGSSQLWRYEYMNVLTRQARLGHVSFEDGLLGYQFAETQLYREFGVPPVNAVFGISHRYMVSGRDAVFLYWAQELDTPLVTFDKKLRRAAPGLTVAPGELTH